MKITAIVHTKETSRDWEHQNRSGNILSGTTKYREIESIAFETKEIEIEDLSIRNLLSTIHEKIKDVASHAAANAAADALEAIKPEIAIMSELLEIYQNDDNDSYSKIKGLQNVIDAHKLEKTSDFLEKYGKMVAKLQVMELPETLYITTKNETDEFGCCCSSPGTYCNTLPVQLSTTKPDHSSQFTTWDRCRVYKKMYASSYMHDDDYN
ncbi:Hypothetical protein POVR1_LOCUS492 [uncultured virus]|nr:Hypothetical protein POVR1_LOCUS492 [uncultured virus]